MRRIAALAATVALATGIGITAAQPASAATYYCKQVTAQTVNMYWHSTGYEVRYQLTTGVKFYATSSEYGRYYGTVDPNHVYNWGWITTSTAYTKPC